MFLFGLISAIFYYGSIALVVFVVFSFFMDRFVKVNHTFDTIQRPSHLSGVTVGNLVIPTTTLYIPADKSVCNPETAPVVFLIPGNPGVAEFYSETMREMHSASGKKTHIYCSGHAGQGLIVNQARLSAYLERRKKKFGESSANILPRFECDTLFEDKVRIDLERARAKIAKTLAADAKHKKDDGDGNISSSASKAKSSGGGSGSGGGGAFGDLPSALRDAATNVRANAIQSGGADAKRGGQGQSEDDISAECLGEIENDIDFLSYPFGENAVFDLRSQVQHKLAVLTQLRRLHPYSKFIIAGHSVGGYISLEVLRSIDRIEEIIRSKDRRHAERKDNEYDLRPETFESKLHSASTSTSTSSSSTSSTSPSTLSSPLCPRAAFVLENLYFSDDDWERSEEKNARSADNEALKQMKEMGTDRNDMAVGTSRVLLSVSELEEYKDIALPVRQHPSTIAADSSLSSLSPEYVESLEHRKPGGSSFVAQVQLLCPTVHNIASTPNGYFFTPIFYQWRTTLVLIFMLVASLPGFVRRTLAMIGASPFKSPDCYAATRLMLHTQSLQNIVFMAMSEMSEIGELDQEHVHRHAHKLWFLLSSTDGWVPMGHVEHLLNVFKGTTARLDVDRSGLEHAFVMGQAPQVAKLMWERARVALEEDPLPTTSPSSSSS